jgi:hypothetical protein
MIPFDGLTAGDPPKLIDRAKLLTDVRDKTTFYMVGAHGAMAMEKDMTFKMGIVPDGTYLIFNGPAGCMSHGIVPFHETLVENSEVPFENAIVKDITKSIERMARIEEGANMDPDTNFLFKTPSPLERSTLKTPAKCYPTGFSEANVRGRTTMAPCISDSSYTTRTIYGPGEQYNDMLTDFNSGPDGIILLGGYKLPIQSDLFTVLVRARPGPSELNTFDRMTFVDGAAKYGNLLPAFIGRRSFLSDVLAALPAAAEGKKRVVFINACRGFAEITPFVADVGARLARAKSISGNLSRMEVLTQADKAYLDMDIILNSFRELAELDSLLNKMKGAGTDGGDAAGDVKLDVYNLIQTPTPLPINKGVLRPINSSATANVVGKQGAFDAIVRKTSPAAIKIVEDIRWKTLQSLVIELHNNQDYISSLRTIFPRNLFDIHGYFKRTNPYLEESVKQSTGDMLIQSRSAVSEESLILIGILMTLYSGYKLIKSDSAALAEWKEKGEFMRRLSPFVGKLFDESRLRNLADTMFPFIPAAVSAPASGGAGAGAGAGASAARANLAGRT